MSVNVVFKVLIGIQKKKKRFVMENREFFLECQNLKFQYSVSKISKCEYSQSQILKFHDLVANQWLIITHRNDFNIVL